MKEDTVSPYSRTVSLCLTLGVCIGLCGLHRLYTGRVFTFILQLVTLGGLFIWQIADIAAILLGIFRDARGRVVTRW